MESEPLDRLLHLHRCDARLDEMRRKLEQFPEEEARDREAIARLAQELADREHELKRLDVKRSEIEGSIAEAEAKSVKYKTQQMQVKKNEEYQALEHEIKAIENTVSDLEDEELGILESIDERRDALNEARELVADETRALEGHLRVIAEARQDLESEIAEAESDLKDAMAAMEPADLSEYLLTKTRVRRPPYVVELNGAKCTGCHLRVSGEVEGVARKGQGPVRCDNCGRLVYWPR